MSTLNGSEGGMYPHRHHLSSCYLDDPVQHGVCCVSLVHRPPSPTPPSPLLSSSSLPSSSSHLLPPPQQQQQQEKRAIVSSSSSAHQQQQKVEEEAAFLLSQQQPLSLRHLSPDYEQCRTASDPHITLRSEEILVNALPAAYHSSGYPSSIKAGGGTAAVDQQQMVYGAFSNLRAVRIDTLNLPPTETIVISKAKGGSGCAAAAAAAPSSGGGSGSIASRPAGHGEEGELEKEEAEEEGRKKTTAEMKMMSEKGRSTLHYPSSSSTVTSPLCHGEVLSQPIPCAASGGFSSSASPVSSSSLSSTLPLSPPSMNLTHTLIASPSLDTRELLQEGRRISSTLSCSSSASLPEAGEMQALQEKEMNSTDPKDEKTGGGAARKQAKVPLGGMPRGTPTTKGVGGTPLSMTEGGGEKVGSWKKKKKDPNSSSSSKSTRKMEKDCLLLGSSASSSLSASSSSVFPTPHSLPQGVAGDTTTRSRQKTPGRTLTSTRATTTVKTHTTTTSSSRSSRTSSGFLSSPTGRGGDGAAAPIREELPVRGGRETEKRTSTMVAMAPPPSSSHCTGVALAAPRPPPPAAAAGGSPAGGLMETLLYVKWRRAGNVFQWNRDGGDRGAAGSGAAGHPPSRETVSSPPPAGGTLRTLEEHLQRFPEGIVAIHTSNHIHRLVVEGDLGIAEEEEAEEEKRRKNKKKKEQQEGDGGKVQVKQSKSPPPPGPAEEGGATATSSNRMRPSHSCDDDNNDNGGGLSVTYQTWIPPSLTSSKKEALEKKIPNVATPRPLPPPFFSTASHPEKPNSHHKNFIPVAPPPPSSSDVPSSSPPIIIHAKKPKILSSCRAETSPSCARTTPSRTLAAPVQHTLTAVATFTHLTVYFTAHQDGQILLSIPIQTYSMCLASRRVTAHRLLILARRENDFPFSPTTATTTTPSRTSSSRTGGDGGSSDASCPHVHLPVSGSDGNGSASPERSNLNPHRSNDKNANVGSCPPCPPSVWSSSEFFSSFPPPPLPTSSSSSSSSSSGQPSFTRQFSSLPLRVDHLEESLFFPSSSSSRQQSTPASEKGSSTGGDGGHGHVSLSSASSSSSPLPTIHNTHHSTPSIFRDVDAELHTITALPSALTVSPLLLLGNENGDIILVDILQSNIVLRLNYAGYSDTNHHHKGQSGTPTTSSTTYPSSLLPSSSSSLGKNNTTSLSGHSNPNNTHHASSHAVYKAGPFGGVTSSSPSKKGKDNAKEKPKSAGSSWYGGEEVAAAAAVVGSVEGFSFHPTTSTTTSSLSSSSAGQMSSSAMSSRSRKIVHSAVSCIAQVENGLEVFLSSLIHAAAVAKREKSRKVGGGGGGGRGLVVSPSPPTSLANASSSLAVFPEEIGPSIFAVGFDSGDILLICVMCEGGWVLRHFNTSFFGAYPIDDIAVQAYDVVLRLWVSYVPAMAPTRASTSSGSMKLKLPPPSSSSASSASNGPLATVEGVPPAPPSIRSYRFSRTIVMDYILTGIPQAAAGGGSSTWNSLSSFSSSPSITTLSTRLMGNGEGGGGPVPLAAIACGGGFIYLVQLPDLVVLHKIQAKEYNAVGSFYALHWFPSQLDTLLLPDLLVASGEDDTLTTFQLVFSFPSTSTTTSSGGGNNNCNSHGYYKRPPPLLLPTPGTTSNTASAAVAVEGKREGVTAAGTGISVCTSSSVSTETMMETLRLGRSPTAATAATIFSSSSSLSSSSCPASSSYPPDEKEMKRERTTTTGERNPPPPLSVPFRSVSPTASHGSSSNNNNSTKVVPSHHPVLQSFSSIPSSSSSSYATVSPSFKFGEGEGSRRPKNTNHNGGKGVTVAGTGTSAGAATWVTASFLLSRGLHDGHHRRLGGVVRLSVCEKKLFHRSWVRSISTLPLVVPLLQGGKGLPKYYGVVLAVTSYDGTVSFWPHVFRSPPPPPPSSSSCLTTTTTMCNTTNATSTPPIPPVSSSFSSSSCGPLGESASASNVQPPSVVVSSALPCMNSLVSTPSPSSSRSSSSSSSTSSLPLPSSAPPASPRTATITTGTGAAGVGVSSNWSPPSPSPATPYSKGGAMATRTFGEEGGRGGVGETIRMEKGTSSSSSSSSSFSSSISSRYRPLLLLKGPTSVYKLHTDLTLQCVCGGAGTSFFMVSACCRGKVKFWSTTSRE